MCSRTLVAREGEKEMTSNKTTKVVDDEQTTWSPLADRNTNYATVEDIRKLIPGKVPRSDEIDALLEEASERLSSLLRRS